MYFLKAFNSKGHQVILHVRGATDERGQRFIDQEGIFIVERRKSDARVISMHVTKQVGYIDINEEGPQFIYTDKDFKKSINYQEDTGFSTLDGASWSIQAIRYVSPEGQTEQRLKPHSSISMMYSGAKNPFNRYEISDLLSMIGLFSSLEKPPKKGLEEACTKGNVNQL